MSEEKEKEELSAPADESEETNLIDRNDPDAVDPLGALKPRQRRLAQLLAEGKTNGQIQEELGYSASRISILQNNPAIRAEVARLQDKLFEASIEQRLKDFNNMALDHVEMVLKDRTNRVKVSEKNEIAKWVIEMQKSKAPQVHDIGQNMLSALMDRLDARKTDKRGALHPQGARAVEALPDVETEAKLLPEPAKAEPKDELASWVEDFCTESE